MVHLDNLLQRAAVGCREHLDCGSMCRGGGSKIGDGFHGFLLDLLLEVLHGDIVGGMVDRALGSLLKFLKFLMGNCEIFFL